MRGGLAARLTRSATSVNLAIAVSTLLCWVTCQPVLAAATVRIGGRLDADIAHYDQDVTPLESGADLRRLRLELGGRLTHKLRYYTDPDFTDGNYQAQSAWLSYRINKRNALYAGRVEIPFSLQQVTNSQSNLFMERALPASLSPHYGTGLAYMFKGDQWSFRTGVFGDDWMNFGGTTDSGTAIAARLGRRLRSGDSGIWLGASAMYQQPTQPEQFQARPESSVTSEHLVNTGRISNVHESLRMGLEGVWKNDHWSVQGEWAHYTGDRNEAANVNLGGGYLEVSRMFNGRRRFNFRRGEWMLPEVGEKGAFELAARVSQVDLQDGPVTGGRETNFSLALNYYINPINRIMFNWIKVDAHPNNDGIDESPSILQVRFQVGF